MLRTAFSTHSAPAAALALALALSPSRAAPADTPSPCADVACLERRIGSLEKEIEARRLAHDEILKRIDDVLWFDRVGDVASVDKVYLTGPPDPNAEETYGIANARHPFRFWSYVFVPRKLAKDKAPLVVLPHGGVHADFTTHHTHVVRELVLAEHLRKQRWERPRGSRSTPQCAGAPRQPVPLRVTPFCGARRGQAEKQLTPTPWVLPDRAACRFHRESMLHPSHPGRPGGREGDYLQRKENRT